MCELLGFSAADEIDIRRQLQGFFAHSSKHPHGWGLMTGDRSVVKRAERAIDSTELAGLINSLPPQRTVLAHIRYATVGSVKEENCHPFTQSDITGRVWTMIHNGTIYSGSRLVPMMNEQKGDTDSERLFIYLMKAVNAAQSAGQLSAGERFGLIEGVVKEFAPRNKLNLMIYDGELLYVHKNMENTMAYRRFGSGYIFATEPVDDDKGWQRVPLAQLKAYRAGELAFTGEVHNGIFVPTLQYITALDAMNI